MQLRLTLLILFCSAGCTVATAQIRGTDSVKIPSALLKKISVDLDKYDDCKEENALLKKKDAAAGNSIAALKTELEGVRQRNGELGARLTADSILTAGLDKSYQLNIEALQEQINAATRRQKWGTFQKVLIGIGALATGFLVGRAF